MEQTAINTNNNVPNTPRAISWEAPEFEYKKKGADWFFSFAIIMVSLIVAAMLLGSNLFALLIIVATLVLTILALKKPSIVPYAVTTRGVKVEDEIYPYSSLKSYYIDEEDPKGVHLLILTKRHFMPIIAMPLPVDHIHDIETILNANLPEEFLEESILMRVLENFGF